MHRQLGSTCLMHIHLLAFSSPVMDEEDLEWRLEDNVFAAYANQNFDYHISKCTEISKGMMDQLEKIFQQKGTYLAAILQIKILRGGHDYGIITQYFDRMAFPVSPSTVIYSSSLYNVTEIRKQWIDQATPKYVLHFAAAAGLTSAITR